MENPEKEIVEHTKAIILRSEGELKEPKRIKVDDMELDYLVAKENKSTSLKPNEMREEVVEIISEMTIWGEMHKELKNEKMTPITEVDDFFFQLNKENERANIVRKEEKKFLMEVFVRICAQVDHN